MTTLINKIKADQVEARKGRVATAKIALLTTLLGETTIIGKNAGRETTDAEVVAVIQKFIKNIDECLAVEKEPLKIAAYTCEKAILDGYRPVQITKEQMIALIAILRTEKNDKLSLKDIMQGFKTQFAGMYDGKLLADTAQVYVSAQD